jgi:hypothetical protein
VSLSSGLPALSGLVVLAWCHARYASYSSWGAPLLSTGMSG